MPTKSDELKEKIMQFIEEGLIIEDEIVKHYAKVLEFSEYFNSLDLSTKDKIQMNIDTLVEDTKRHIGWLNQIKNNIEKYEFIQ